MVLSAKHDWSIEFYQRQWTGRLTQAWWVQWVKAWCSFQLHFTSLCLWNWSINRGWRSYIYICIGDHLMGNIISAVGSRLGLPVAGNGDRAGIPSAPLKWPDIFSKWKVFLDLWWFIFFSSLSLWSMTKPILILEKYSDFFWKHLCNDQIDTFQNTNLLF